jgi:flagellar export protein FliJ
MRRFQFRAQAVLDLRRREHDDARRALAAAERELAAATRLHADADAALREARTRALEAMGGALPAAQLAWHRAWLVRLEHQRTALAAAVTARDADVRRAAEACARARQRLESLERLRDKAREAWERAARAEEQKAIDALAGLRHIGNRRHDAPL